MAETDLLDQGRKLWERDMLTGYLAIVVAGNGMPGARTVTVDGLKGPRDIMLPDWGAAEWSWWLRVADEIAIGFDHFALANGIQTDAKEAAEIRALQDEVQAAIRELDSGRVLPDAVKGDDEMGWLAIAGRLLMVGGRLVLRQGVRVARWAAPKAKKAIAWSWTKVSGMFKAAPIKTTAGLMLLTTPDTAIKVVRSAAQFAGEMFAAVPKGLLAGLGPLGVVLLLGGAWYLFGRGK